MHPHWQTLARDEVLKVCGSRDLPSSRHLPNLKLLSMIVNESLRLYPPTVASIRRAKADVELGAYKVPSGTELLIPILAVHHDKASWGSDANEFNPTRFANGASRAAKHPMAFMPFGVGARSCIGQHLATLQAKIAVAVMLQKCNLRLAPSYRHAPTVLLMLHPQHGAPVIFERRRMESNDPSQ
uniref:Cytochrome P450 n=1 Tax=Kalanchoe fedtschenkoi TaxID=63787 RepID=A0A7N0UKY7_KALFE